MIDEEDDLALLSLTSSLAVTSPPLVDRMRVADLPVFLEELKIARRLATSSPIFTSDSEEKRVCEELTTGSRNYSISIVSMLTQNKKDHIKMSKSGRSSLAMINS